MMKTDMVIGSDVLSYLIPVRHPMIMVDRIISFDSEPLSLVAERYVSANESAFTGHFPNLKLWPGIYTMEGLRQACYLLEVLHELEKADLMKGIIELQKRHALQPQINQKLCQETIDYIKNRKTTDPDLFSIKVKLLEPVFAGSLIKYYCSVDDNNPDYWSVRAIVDERLIAKGNIVQTSYKIS
ncbi:beta-hydroxyacyl-ACP dehydratase [Labilibacter sediminis]|nr:beta-hydroxyacyl-ACP dehydratase [Labilibacter sediminis]